MVKIEQQREANEGEEESDERRVAIIQTSLDRQASTIRPNCIPQVECHLHARRAQHLAAGGKLNQKELLGTADAEETECYNAHQEDGYPAVRREEENAEQRNGHQSLHRRRRPSGREINTQPSATEIAKHHPCAREYHQAGDSFRFKAGDMCQHRTDIAVPAERPAIAHHRCGEQKPRCQMAQETELSAKTGVG